MKLLSMQMNVLKHLSLHQFTYYFLQQRYFVNNAILCSGIFQFLASKYSSLIDFKQPSKIILK